MLFDSTESQSIELKSMWKKVNANEEKTAELTNKVIEMSEWHGYFISEKNVTRKCVS